MTNFITPICSGLRVRTAWFDHMCTLAPIDAVKFISTARPLIPLIEAAAVKLLALTAVNRTVHTPTYNRLITEAVAKCAA